MDEKNNVKRRHDKKTPFEYIVFKFCILWLSAL